jgi:hypothetical protein
MKTKNSYYVLYGNGHTETLKYDTQLQAEKEAHRKAHELKTLVIYVKLILL